MAEELVIAKPINLAIAIVKFATKAVMIVLVPPVAAMVLPSE